MLTLETAKKITFGTDGFRGIIAADFTYENIRRIAQGFCDFLAYKGFKDEDVKIFIGYDRRFLSDKFAREFATVLINNDINCVLSSTPVTTPLVSYLTTKDFKFGVIITASHNNFLYNGVKIKHNGRSALPSMTSEIELYIEKNRFIRVSRTPKKPIVEIDPKQDYVNYIRSRFDIDKIFSKIKGNIVVDFMYGCGAEIYNELLGKYKNIVAIRTKKDPLFGEIAAPEPKEDKLDALKSAVKENKAMCGFALDGDGDRFACVDEKANYLAPTIVAPIILDYLVNNKKMDGKVVQAVSLGFLTQRIAREKGMIFEFTPVGFKYIADRIVEGGTIFGAEESGGYAWKGCIPERDGFVTMLMMLEILSESKKSLSEIVKDIESRYGNSYFIREDILINKPVQSKYSFAMKIKSKLPKEILSKKISEIITLDGIRVVLENDWWFLARPSGTEPLLRIYAESDSLENSKKMVSFVKEIVFNALQ